MIDVGESKEQQSEMIWCVGRWRLFRRFNFFGYYHLLGLLIVLLLMQFPGFSRSKRCWVGNRAYILHITEDHMAGKKKMLTSVMKSIHTLPRFVNVKQDMGYGL